jgi:Glycosyl hydrolases family 2, sugar binding domain/Glycosyl hydrolases family 2/Glycosyl hydrolases family 2, TIM barrel domain
LEKGAGSCSRSKTGESKGGKGGQAVAGICESTCFAAARRITLDGPRIQYLRLHYNEGNNLDAAAQRSNWIAVLLTLPSMNSFRPPRCGRAGLLAFVVLAVLGLALGAQAGRTELDLGGSWQFQKVSQLSFPPSNNWQTITVPGYLSGWQYEHAWFRRRFTLPPSMAGTQLELRFGGVKYKAEVWLNGVSLGGYLNGYNPFELDITAAALINQTNELIVGVTDWSATFAAPVDFSTLGPYENPRDHAKNTFLAPIGGRYELYGIWQPVKVVSLPPVSIADAFLMPSVRSQQLTVHLTLRNDSALIQTVSITNRVLDGASTALALPDRQVTVPPLTNTQLDITAPWASPHLWSPPDPYLYYLETTVASALGQDQLRTRFGFREFWDAGGSFYLNGTPIHLLATATWPPSDLEDTNQIRKVLTDVKAGNNVAIRFHTQPWDEPWYDIADEVGLLVVEECAVWCDSYSYRLSDATFWTNYSQHLWAAVQRDRNHPAIVLWSPGERTPPLRRGAGLFGH